MEHPRLKELTPEQKKIFSSFDGAKQRCTNKNHPQYSRYGGRGIKYLLEENKTRIQLVVEQENEWRKCKKKNPNERITINRKDNNGHYTESNIEWITQSENTRQMNNDNVGHPAGRVTRKQVKCITTGEVFESTAEAGRQTGISRPSISLCCNGKAKSGGKTADGKKRVWRFVV